MMKFTAFVLSAATLLIAIQAEAQSSTSELNDVELLSKVTDATDAGDADLLLEFMLEVRSRGLLMFAAPFSCQSPVPPVGLLENEILYGRVNWAYHMKIWSMALDLNHCGCAYELLSPDDFSNQLVGKSMSGLTTDDIRAFRLFWRARRDTIEPAYQDFKSKVCGD